VATLGDPRIGSELLGYRIEALVGRGGMGAVYRAEDLALGRNVALKLLAPELASHERFRARFQRESRLAASIDHPSIVPIYEAGEVQGQLYIAMRYVEGPDLGTLLRREGRLEPARALAIVAPVADALDEAHEHGLVHRDVKPSNVLLDTRGRAFLADFGLTKRADDDAELTGGLLGTVDYVAPETIEGSAVDARADVYSLAALLYECLTGRVPFVRDTDLAVLWAHLNDPAPGLRDSPELDPIFEKALAKEPGDRFETCSAFVDAVERGLPKPEPRRARRRGLLLAGVLGLAAAALAAVLGLGRDNGPNTTPTLAITSSVIQRIDPATNRLVATLRVPVQKAELAVGAGSLWAVDSESSAVHRIDPRRNAVTETIQTSGDPLALTFAAGALWILNGRDGVVSRLDPGTGKITAVVPLPPGSYDTPIPFVGTESGVWASWSTDNGNAVHIDTESTKPTVLQVGPAEVTELYGVAPTGPRTLWVLGPNPLDPFTSAVMRVDPTLTDLSRPDVLPISGGHGGCAAADRENLWVTQYGSAFLLRVDTARLRFDRRTRVGSGTCGVAVGDGSVWATNWSERAVKRIDPESGKVLAIIPVAEDAIPVSIAVGAGGVWVDVHPR
jgi:serine/threonine protein kinase/sugar lactone lactonase YvrE